LVDYSDPEGAYPV
jgi:hypothetical protein